MEFEGTNVKEGGSADFGTVLRRNVIRWAAAAVVGGVLGYAAAFLLPPKWEATTLIRIGKVGSLGGRGTGSNRCRVRWSASSWRPSSGTRPRSRYV